MNPFLLGHSERLSAWREFRQGLDGKTETEQLADVALWFSKAPISTYVLDFDQADKWPGPWEVMNGGDFCTTAIAYLMEQTLILAGWNPERLKLHFVRNRAIQDEMMILLIDNAIALNYEHASVFNFDKERSNCAYLVSYQPNADGGHTEV